MTPDVNVLVAAYRDDHPHHPSAQAWLNDALEACKLGGTIEILPMVAAGFLRVVTHRKAFPRGPASPAQAVAFLDSILKRPGVSMPHLGPEWKLFQKLCVDLELTGNDVADTWIAAAVSVGGHHFVTFDRGFARLLRPSELTVLRPDSRVREPRGRYTVHRPQRRAA